MTFHADLIGLHMLQVEFGLRHHRLMNPLALLPSSFLPSCDRALIQIKGVNNRLERTAIGQQRYHQRDQFLRFA